MTRRYPNTPVLYRRLDKAFATIVRGEGCRLYDETGKDYLDGSGGAYVANLGHGIQAIVDRVAEQIRKVAYVSGMSFTNEPVEELATELASLTVGDLDKFLFLTSGSDAVEAALKLARQHWVDRGQPAKQKLLALAPGYHGNTMLALSVSRRPSSQAMFKEWLIPVREVPAPYAYRCDCGGAADCPRCTGQALEAAILTEGPANVAAFIGETVGGASTGASVPRPEYWRTVRAICDRYHVLWIADEVLCGAGRTGTWTAVEQYHAVPDIMTMGKGLSGGYAALAAVATSERILAPIAAGTGYLNHNQTFTHTPMMCAAGVAAVRYVKEQELLDRCRRMGGLLQLKLARIAAHPLVGDVRGRGLLAGVELVADRATKRPFPRKAKVAEQLTDAALEEGLVVWPNGGTSLGTDGDLICLAPPFVVTEAELDEMLDRLERALTRVERGLPTAATR